MSIQQMTFSMPGSDPHRNIVELQGQLPQIPGIELSIGEEPNKVSLVIKGGLAIHPHNPRELPIFSETHARIQSVILALHDHFLTPEVRQFLDWLEGCKGNYRPISSLQTLVYRYPGKSFTWGKFGLYGGSLLEYLGSTYTIEWVPDTQNDEGGGLIVLTHKGTFTAKAAKPGGKLSMMERIVQVAPTGKVLGTTFRSEITNTDAMDEVIDQISRWQAYWAAVQAAVESSHWLVASPGSGRES